MNTFSKIITVLAMLFAVACYLFCNQEKPMPNIKTPRGAELTTYLDIPEGNGRFPAVVVAPGLGYNATLPLFAKFADKCIENEIICLRFEWDFYKQNTQPSQDLSHEYEDFASAVDYLGKVPEVDTSKVFLSGKSLGAVITSLYANKNHGFSGLVLFTPPINTPEPPYELRERAGEIGDITAPIAIIYGESDPICKTERLNELVESFDNRPEMHRFGGDHSFKGATDAETDKNLENATDAAVEFILKTLGR
ncbi:MAG: hypothetical protein GF315_09435 [candidate division Zixibacteria bacterium]|nr:hypothetical protein [candidate division Zixibacteria bacterium]